ncbi:hypothetical protein COOONC_19150 [Cooperia oncophora]
MAPAPPRAHDPANGTAPPDTTPAASEKFVNGNMLGTTESPLSSSGTTTTTPMLTDSQRSRDGDTGMNKVAPKFFTVRRFVFFCALTDSAQSKDDDSSQNLYASVDSIDDGGSQNIYAPQVRNPSPFALRARHS